MTRLNYKSKMMSSFLLKSAFVVVFFQQCFSASIDTPYLSFVANLTQNSCELPSNIPFQIKNVETTLEDSLHVCNTPDYYKLTQEVPILCNEIFGLLKNISCPPNKEALPHITVSLSPDVCGDFESNKAILPKGLLLHLSDSFNCNIMCSNNFEAPCKVLLWSFLVKYQMLNPETPETSLKNMKNSSPIETKTTLSLQTSVQINTANATKPDAVKTPAVSVSATKSDAVKTPAVSVSATKSDAVKTPAVSVSEGIAGSQTSDTAQNTQNESTKPIDPVPEQPKPETVTVVDNTQENAVNNPEVSKIETKADGIVELKPSIPTNNTLGSTKNNKENLDGVVNNDLVSKIPQYKIDLTKIVDAKPQPELPPVPEAQNNQNFFSEDNNLSTATIIPNNQETENDGSSVQLESVTDVPNNLKNKETTKTDQVSVSEKKDKDSAASPVVKLPSNLPVEPTKDSATVDGEVSEIVSSPTSVVSVSVTPSLEKMDEEIPLPNEKDNDQYNLDNAEGDIDGEYSKQDYGADGMYQPAKTKESISTPPKSADPDVPQIDEKAFNGLSRGSFSRGSEEIQEFATFPDQEDSHFFFYFLSIVLILMAGYLIFHNKQKIIALIVEGRHERRRRSHGLGYKKLETK